MKKKLVALIVFIFILAASQVWAAEDWKVARYGASNNGNILILKITATSGTTGLYTANTVITAALAKSDYHKMGYFLGHAYVVNGAVYPDQAATVTIADTNGQQIVGSTVGDTLTVSTASAGAAGYLVSTRGTAQRPCFDLYNITIADTQSGTATTVLYLYLVFVR